MSETMTGSCLCGAVTYTISGEVIAAANCHCNTCKKNTGAAFSTLIVVSEDDLHIDDPEKKLVEYRVSDKAVKHFCSKCGTPIYNSHVAFPGFAMVLAGSLDQPCKVAPNTNFFCSRMLPWVNDIADLENFDRLRDG